MAWPAKMRSTKGPRAAPRVWVHEPTFPGSEKFKCDVQTGNTHSDLVDTDVPGQETLFLSKVL